MKQTITDELKMLLEKCELYAEKDDSETAHCYEKSIWEKALKAIAEGEPSSNEIAELALSSEKIDFSRWYK